jgi:glycine cleavage system regulatory protein/folate-dependent phosphoribosylglycinamide formyltransferase PurN
MKIALVGSRYFGATVLKTLLEDGADVAQVVAPASDDRLAVAARQAGLPLHILENPKIVPAEAIPEGAGLIVAAHTHARVSNEALARSRHGGVGYHPSLLPRHRGIAAVEWTIMEGDPIAGGSVYHLADGWDAGAIAAQDWCFVGNGETARELWERALAPMGLALLRDVVRNLREGGELPARRQDEQFATRAPMIRRTVTLSEAKEAIPSSLVATVIGPDRPGIVRQISERAKGFGANWTASRMSSLGSQFAGIVQFEVAPEHAEGLTVALRGLESAGLQVAIARSDSAPPPPGRRIVALEMTGVDRPGIVRELSSGLAERGVSIEDLHTEVVNGATAAEHQFRVKAVLFVPNTVRNEELRNALKALATEMKIDLALDEYEAG